MVGPVPAILRTERRKKVEKNHETEMTMTMKVPIWMYASTRVGRRHAPANKKGNRFREFRIKSRNLPSQLRLSSKISCSCLRAVL